VQISQIDWLDFVVVESIDFNDEDKSMNNNYSQQFLQPTQMSMQAQVQVQVQANPNANGNLNGNNQTNYNHELEEYSANANNNVNNGGIKGMLNYTEDIDMEVNGNDSNRTNNDANRDVTLFILSNIKIIMNEDQDLPEPNMKIVKNYVRRVENKSKIEQSQKCPLCKQNISINEWSDHLRIELLDPKWREIKQELLERKMEISLAPSEDVLNYLNSFSKYRPDLFGDVTDEVSIHIYNYSIRLE